MKRPERAREASSITAASAQLLAWLGLALLNQGLIVWLLPGATAGVRALHHAYDAGQLLAAGALSWLGVLVLRLIASRFAWSFVGSRWWQSVLLASVVLLVGLATTGGDVANFAERTGSSRTLVSCVLSAICALVLGATRLLSAPHWWWLRIASALVGVTLAVVNGLYLEGDYVACHLMATWLSALLLGGALEGLALPGFSRARELALAALIGTAGIFSVLVPPKGDVRIRLYALPSSVFAPLVARFLPQEQVATDLVPQRYMSSPWFGDRRALPEVPATGAIKPRRPPIVMFFTVDAFRADLLDEPEQRKSLPTFARLRKASSYFANAHAPTTSTMTTMASVFSGKYYTQLLWQRGKKPPLIEPTARFPELLQRAGVRTAAFAGAQGRINSNNGIALGFSKEVVVSAQGKPASNNVTAIIDELEASTQTPLFMYAHFIEPHGPYTLGGKGGSAFERYLREVMLVDRELKRLTRYLQAKGLADDTYIIISADHGEAFGEHASFGHAKTVYEEQARVPFFFLLPGREGRELSIPVTLMDVGPTVLDLFGLPTPGHWMGQSLLPVVAGQKSSLERPIALDTSRRMQAFFFEDRFKVIFNRDKQTTEVFNLSADPRELHNLAAGAEPRVKQAVQTAELFFSRIRRSADAGDGAGLEE